MGDVRKMRSTTRSGPSGEQLADIRALRVVEKTRKQEIVDFLSRHQSLKAFVSREGTIYYSSSAEGSRELSDLRRSVRSYGLIDPESMKNGSSVKMIAVLPEVYETFLGAAEATEEDTAVDQSDGGAAAIVYAAIRMDASDIHIEARAPLATILFRIDGVMRIYSDGISYEQAMRTIKTLFESHDFAKTDFEPHDACDAVFNIDHKGSTHMVRMSAIPTTQGSKLVARIRNPTEIIDVQDSGYSLNQLSIIRRAMRLTEGLVLFCGPTNSGKSTTVTSLLAKMSRARCVLELSDPVEAHLSNVSHVDLQPKGDDAEERADRLTEATVRQDPDVLVLGEIRNYKTVKAAEKLAEQGKLVISTLHVGTVVGIPKRLEGLGMEAHLLSLPNFFRAATAQKLISRLCKHCRLGGPIFGSKEEEIETLVDLKRINWLGKLYAKNDAKEKGTELRETTLRYHNPDGCDYCGNTGVKGRTLVAETMWVDERVREILQTGRFGDLREYLIRTQGMESIHEHALSKIILGEIDPLRLEDRIERIEPDALRFIPPEIAENMKRRIAQQEEEALEEIRKLGAHGED